MIATKNDFVLDVLRHVADEYDWNLIHDSGPANGRLLMYGRGPTLISIDIDRHGSIVKAVKLNYPVEDVAHTYVHDVLPLPRGGSNTQFKLVPILRMFEGSF